MKQVYIELEIGRSLLILSEALVFATVWFFVLRAFSSLDSSSIPFAVGTIYVLGLVISNVALYVFVRLSISTWAVMQAILVKMEREDIVPQPRRRRGFWWMAALIFCLICVIMSVQGMAVLGAHLAMPLIGKPAFSEGIRNFAIGMALVGNSVVFVPAVLVWLGVKLLHKRIVHRKMHESESNNEELNIEPLVSKLSAFRIPMPQREARYFPIPITGIFNLARIQA